MKHLTSFLLGASLATLGWVAIHHAFPHPVPPCTSVDVVSAPFTAIPAVGNGNDAYRRIVVEDPEGAALYTKIDGQYELLSYHPWAELGLTDTELTLIRRDIDIRNQFLIDPATGGAPVEGPLVNEDDCDCEVTAAPASR